MELLNTLSNKVWVNSVDYSLGRLLSELGSGNTPYSIQDVDYLPDFKFRRVVKNLRITNEFAEVILRAAQTANLINPNAKYLKKKSKKQKALVALDRMYKKYGTNAYVDDERGLVVFKEIEGMDYGLRHNISFMPSLKNKNIDLYWFMCSFIKTCQMVGIQDYQGEYYEYYIQDLMVNDDYDIEESVRMERYSYLYGYPKLTMDDINKAPLLMPDFNVTFKLPLDISSDIRKLTQLAHTGIQISHYEMDNDTDSYRSIAECNVFSWDEGEIEENVCGEINDYVNNYGLMHMADFSIYNYSHKPFCNQGHLLQQFLRLFCETNIFKYFNGNYTPISAYTDGTKIYHRDILGQAELQY